MENYYKQGYLSAHKGEEYPNVAFYASTQAAHKAARGHEDYQKDDEETRLDKVFEYTTGRDRKYRNEK